MCLYLQVLNIGQPQSRLPMCPPWCRPGGEGLAGAPGTRLWGPGQEATLQFTAWAGATQSHQEERWGLPDKPDP